MCWRWLQGAANEPRCERQAKAQEAERRSQTTGLTIGYTTRVRALPIGSQGRDVA